MNTNNNNISVSAGKSIILVIFTLLLTMISSGCHESVIFTPEDEALFNKPVIGVVPFRNMAPASTKWQLGDGLTDQLINRLIKTRRYIVLERESLQTIFAELSRVDDDKFRAQGRPTTGNLKHVEYLVKGTITDFGHVETVQGILRLVDWGWAGSSSYSRVAATISVIDLESGEVVACESVEAMVRDKKDKEKVELENAAFGSYTFYDTSIGKATSQMLDKAVRKITKIIANKPYQPKISSIVNGQVIINGGRDRKIHIGDSYIVREKSRRVSDPDSGDNLGFIAGKIVGRVQIVQVAQKFSTGIVVAGNSFKEGQTLFRIDAETGFSYSNDSDREVRKYEYREHPTDISSQ